MYKQFLAGSMMVLASSMVFANTGGVALTSVQSTDEEIILPITLNNQANANISTDSPLIPSIAKNIAPQGAELFELKIPATEGTKRIRYSHESSGCDFYVTVNRMGPMGLQAYIAAIPIDTRSSCNVATLGDVNHLSVAF